MTLQVDHVVHVVRDLEQAAATFRALGFHVCAGGQHLSWGTHNALIYFDLAYIELVSILDPRVAALSEFGSPIMERLKAGEGPETIAFASSDIHADVAAFRDRGVAVSGPRPGNRRRSDGSVVAWQMALPAWPLPFLIQWDQGPDSRRAELEAKGLLAPHPLGADLQLARVGWAVHDLTLVSQWMEATYGLTFGLPVTDDVLNAQCMVAAQGLMLCSANGPGPVDEQLRTFGEGAFLYDLSGGTGPVRLIEPSATHGAWIRIGA